jgi:gliding motility-associated lipoprotein GldD
MNMTLKLLLLLFLSSFFFACSEEPPIPKPKTYLLLETTQPIYSQIDDKNLPFTFAIPDYGKIAILNSEQKDSKWFNIIFDKYGFEANVSYIPLKSDTALVYMINDCYTFLDRHKKFSSGIIEQTYANPKDNIYGTIFEIKGSEVVSPYQFYVTDSTKHFLRLALHCKTAPNNDSLSTYIKRITTDLNYMITTLRWRK